MDNRTACACGRGLPRIGKIEGRVQSIIIGADGQYLPGTFFAHLLKDYDHAIRHYQVVQDKPVRSSSKIVKGGRFSDQALSELIAVLQRFLGARMQINVEFTDTIPMVRTGKRLVSVSKLKIDLQEGGSDDGVRSRRCRLRARLMSRKAWVPVAVISRPGVLSAQPPLRSAKPRL